MHKRLSYTPPVPPSSTSSGDSPLSVAQLGTIRYKGPVPPTIGTWYGVEWDDPSRGKHSGVYEKTGQRFFETRVEGAGSFLRPEAQGLETTGKTFKHALFSKYLDVDLLAEKAGQTVPPTPSESEKVDDLNSQLFATNSNFNVEVVLSKKVNDRFKQLGRLREVGLEWEKVSRAAEEAGEADLTELGAQLSRLEVLNLSYSFLPTLGEAARIAFVLPRLQHLALNSNRFEPLAQPTALPGFERLTSLQLNNTLISWSELLNISSSLVNLVSLELSSNRLQRLRNSTVERAREPVLPKLERLNLDLNELTDWRELVEELSVVPSLTELILSSNRFSDLSLPPQPPIASALRTLRHLSLSDNLLTSWSTSLDALAACSTTFPSLTGARLAGNPLIAPSDSSTTPPDEASERAALHARLLSIARWPALLELEGTAVTPAERDDAERFWLERLEKGEEKESELSEVPKERVAELRKRHGVASQPLAASKPSARLTLKDRLLHLHVRLDSSLPLSPSSSKLELSVLPTLRTLLLRAQISRLVGKPLPKTKYRLVAILRGGEGEGQEQEVKVEIPPNEEGKEVSWWGLTDGDSVGVEPF
ncbi:hypothetical protein JCM8547_000575 [Rhodosporidiobolus lusitaniae]